MHIVTEFQDGVQLIGFNRPDKKNAITAAMYSAMADALQQAENDPKVRVVLFYGKGDCFTAGNDLQDFMNAPPHGENSPVFSFLTILSQAKKPLVAAVQGVAVGIGTTLLLHCDLVYAAQNARLHLPFVDLGLCPEAASSFLLPQLLGHQRAAELLLLSEPFGAEKAREYGLVNAVYADSTYLDEALKQARRLAAKPPASLRLTKALIKRALSPAISEVFAEEAGHFGKRLASPEAAEAFKAFFEKRKPDFSKFQ